MSNQGYTNGVNMWRNLHEFLFKMVKQIQINTFIVSKIQRRVVSNHICEKKIVER